MHSAQRMRREQKWRNKIQKFIKHEASTEREREILNMLSLDRGATDLLLYFSLFIVVAEYIGPIEK